MNTSTLAWKALAMTSRRRGFKLIELMVVVVIIGVLLGLLVPVLNFSRRTARLEQCSRNMRNVGLGFLGYLNTKGYLPNAGTFREPTATPPATWTQPSVIGGSFSDVTGIPFWQPSFAGGASEGRDAGPLRSWVVDIMPYLDCSNCANAWNIDRSYGASALDFQKSTGMPGNAQLAANSMGVLTCPEDTTVVPDQGNLSFVVNGGFSRWWYVPTLGWTGQRDGGVDNTTGPDWGPGVAGQTGVMFLGSDTGTMPWDRRTWTADITDGTSQTILASENLRAGFSPGSPQTGGLQTNWACPHPNYVMFIASDEICPGGHCPTGDVDPTLSPSITSGRDGNAWQKANPQGKGAYESINYGLNVKSEGMFPFPSSNHVDGINVLLCDGSVRFLSDTIDGTVYAGLITPAGLKLPRQYRQLPFPSPKF